MGIDLNYHLIGMRLRAVRKKRGLTQERLAELAGISPQHCSGIETGAAKVSLAALVQLCNVLDVTPNEILMDSVKQSTPIYLKDMADTFADCTPDELFLMLSQAENLKNSLRLKDLHLTKKGYL